MQPGSTYLAKVLLRLQQAAADGILLPRRSAAAHLLEARLTCAAQRCQVGLLGARVAHGPGFEGLLGSHQRALQVRSQVSLIAQCELMRDDA
jgi:hypothetical protein